MYAPKGDRIVVFWSDGRTPHEVLPARTQRFGLSVWFSCSAERPNDDAVRTDAGGAGSQKQPQSAAGAAMLAASGIDDSSTSSLFNSSDGDRGHGRGKVRGSGSVGGDGGTLRAGGLESGSGGVDASIVREHVYFEAVGKLAQDLFCTGCSFVPKLITQDAALAVREAVRQYVQQAAASTHSNGAAELLPSGSKVQFWLRAGSSAAFGLLAASLDPLLDHLRGTHGHLADTLAGAASGILVTATACLSDAGETPDTVAELVIQKLPYGAVASHAILVGDEMLASGETSGTGDGAVGGVGGVGRVGAGGGVGGVDAVGAGGGVCGAALPTAAGPSASEASKGNGKGNGNGTTAGLDAEGSIGIDAYIRKRPRDGPSNAPVSHHKVGVGGGVLFIYHGMHTRATVCIPRLQARLRQVVVCSRWHFPSSGGDSKSASEVRKLEHRTTLNAL